MATALLLQTYDGVSDAEAKARADFDNRWKVALGIEIEDRPFTKSTLRVLWAQLILYDKVREVFEGNLRLAKEVGYPNKRSMRVALHTTYTLGRGVVKDTYNLLADGMVKLIWALAAVDHFPVRRWAGTHGCRRYVGSSAKDGAAIDWSGRRAGPELLALIVADADRLLELARQAQERLTTDSADHQPMEKTVELLGQWLLEDVSRKSAADDGYHGVSLKDGVSKERIASIHDPEMCDGPKGKRRRFDDQKAALVVDTDTHLITAVDLLPTNACDSAGALGFVDQSGASTGVVAAETIGDTAYGEGGTRQEFADVGHKYRLSGFRFNAAGGAGCALRPQCIDGTFGAGPTVQLHPREGLFQEARALQQTPDFAECRRRRVKVEHRLARLVRPGMRQALHFGRAETKFRLHVASTVGNLTLATTKLPTAEIKMATTQPSRRSPMLSSTATRSDLNH